jgi:hypothetical protein
VSDFLCCFHVTLAPILRSDFGPYPDFWLAVTQEVYHVLRFGIKIVEVNRDDLLVVELNVHGSSWWCIHVNYLAALLEQGVHEGRRPAAKPVVCA